jgi:formamidopyrimidine-DNA glycosylase
MPELPEVETIVRTLRPRLVGRTILAADLNWSRSLAAPSPRTFRQQVRGQKILDVSRRAKFFILSLTDYSLLIHLRMSGDLTLGETGTTPGKHDRLRLTLSTPSLPAPSPAQDSILIFNDPRKFGRVWFTSRPETVLGGLGPEPLGDDFTPGWLYASLRGRKRLLKPLLLDQSFLAGLGNIYTDEALHRARLHPLRSSDSLSRKKAEALWEAIRSVLAEGIHRNGASIDWVYRGGDFQNYFRVYDRAGQPCPVCGATIKRILVGQRGTHFCPRCQRLE